MNKYASVEYLTCVIDELLDMNEDRWIDTWDVTAWIMDDETGTWLEYQAELTPDMLEELESMEKAGELEIESVDEVGRFVWEARERATRFGENVLCPW